MTSTITINYGSDNIIQLSGLVDSSGAYQNSATVTVTIVDRAGTEVSGETWPLTLVYIASSDGNYKATLTDTISFNPRVKYIAQITADAGAGKKRYWEIPLVVLKDYT